MSYILIKGMEMPKNCPMCPMSHWNRLDEFTGCEIVSGKKYAMNDPEYANSDCRPDWCPLVALPPHGRLIDADALLKGEGRYLVTLQKEAICVDEICRAPTIIPANPAKEGET